jgi:hypothetical protein
LGFITKELKCILYNNNTVEMTNKKVVALVEVAVLTLIALALTVTPSSSWWGFSGSQEAQALVKSVTGSGTGTYTCPSGVPRVV